MNVIKNTSEKNRCIVSITTFSHAHWALVWSESVRATEPQTDCIIFIIDVSQRLLNISGIWPLPSGVQIMGGDTITNTDFRNLRFYYHGLEYAATSKVFVLEHLIYSCGYNQVVFLDGDTQCYQPLDAAWEMMEKYPMVLTPHVFSPCPNDNESPSDLEIVRYGFINAGFWGATRHNKLPAMFAWAKQKMVHFGYFVPNSMAISTEQTWMSALPWLFADFVGILRHPGMNVAYWNLFERNLAYSSAGIICNGQPLIFFHFSGFSYQHPESLTQHRIRALSENMVQALKPLLITYSHKLNVAHQSLPKLQPDLPCCNRNLRQRFRNYRKIHGKTHVYEHRALLGELSFRTAHLYLKCRRLIMGRP